MNCPSCGSADVRVYKTQRESHKSILRNRKCPDCGHRWFTVEVLLPTGAAMWVERTLKRVKGFRTISFQ